MRTTHQPHPRRLGRASDVVAVLIGVLLVLALLPGGMPSLELGGVGASGLGQVQAPRADPQPSTLTVCGAGTTEEPSRPC